MLKYFPSHQKNSAALVGEENYGCKEARDVERNRGRIRRKKTVFCDEKIECG